MSASSVVFYVVAAVLGAGLIALIRWKPSASLAKPRDRNKPPRRVWLAIFWVAVTGFVAYVVGGVVLLLIWVLGLHP